MTGLGAVAPMVVRRLGASGTSASQLLAARASANVVTALTLAPDGRQVVVKARTGPLGSDGTRAAAALRAVGAAVPAHSPLAVPEVLLHDAGTGVLVTEPAPGVPLDAALRAGDLAALHRAGTALAVLHALPAVVGPRVRLADCLRELVRPHPTAVADGLPELRAAVLDVLARVSAAEPVRVPDRPVHRDVHLRQLHADGHRTWLLDWDLAAQGDPALDVGNLVASLRSKRVGEAAVTAVLDGYAEHDSTGALERVPVYEAFAFLRLACKRYRLHGPEARDEVARLLSHAQDRLDGLEADRRGAARG